MFTTITLDEAQAKLRDVVSHLGHGEQVTITDGDKIVARIVGDGPVAGQRPGPGLCKGMMTIVSDDNEHLADFQEYMP